MREREEVRLRALGSAATYGCWETGLLSGSSLLLVRPMLAIFRGDWLGVLWGDLWVYPAASSAAAVRRSWWWLGLAADGLSPLYMRRCQLGYGARWVPGHAGPAGPLRPDGLLLFFVGCSVAKTVAWTKGPTAEQSPRLVLLPCGAGAQWLLIV